MLKSVGPVCTKVHLRGVVRLTVNILIENIWFTVLL